MRLGLVAGAGREREIALAAEAGGLFGVAVGVDEPMTAITAAVYASTATRFARVVPVLRLGLEHPVTIAEEIAILDNVNNGRTIVVVDTGALDAGDAADEVAVLREALSSRALDHDGRRWTVPAGIPANATAPASISVTPKPAQAEVPFWIMGPAAAEVAAQSGLPVVARLPADAGSGSLVQPAITPVSREMRAARKEVAEWAAAGASHLFLALPEGDLGEMMITITRHLAPEVGMPNFPRVMSDSKVPLPWPGEEGRGPGRPG